MLIKSSSALRKSYDKVVEEAKAGDGVVYITRNGEGEMVLLTLEEHQRREAEIKLTLILLDRALSKYQDGEMMSTDDVKQLLASKRAAAPCV